MAWLCPQEQAQALPEDRASPSSHHLCPGLLASPPPQACPSDAPSPTEGLLSARPKGPTRTTPPLQEGSRCLFCSSWYTRGSCIPLPCPQQDPCSAATLQPGDPPSQALDPLTGHILHLKSSIAAPGGRGPQDLAVTALQPDWQGASPPEPTLGGNLVLWASITPASSGAAERSLPSRPSPGEQHATQRVNSTACAL
ncbi:troponin C, skeletal muscle [Platysternon megacephalum]|uniref:Troponin C, skeletal muscle n=1 Tax=Platysternon megacephalum TaxID=55544 RepID=A0A4D9E619_9SAUR|nr:troponin C, skeletal muscle [Platysternon megacephalum]